MLFTTLFRDLYTYDIEIRRATEREQEGGRLNRRRSKHYFQVRKGDHNNKKPYDWFHLPFLSKHNFVYDFVKDLLVGFKISLKLN